MQERKEPTVGDEKTIVAKIQTNHQNTHDDFLNRSVGMAFRTLSSLYFKGLTAEQKEKVYEKSKQEINQLADESKDSELKIALIQFFQRVEEPIDEWDSVFLYLPDDAKETSYNDQKILFPLKEVLSLVWLALHDKDKFDHAPGATEHQLQADHQHRLRDFATCIKERMFEGICHHGIRHNLFGELDKKYRGIDLCIDADAVILTFLKENLAELFWKHYRLTPQNEKEALARLLLQWLYTRDANNIALQFDPEMTLLDKLQQFFIRQGCRPDQVKNKFSSALKNLIFAYDNRRDPKVINIVFSILNSLEDHELLQNKTIFKLQQTEWKIESTQTKVQKFIDTYQMERNLEENPALLPLLDHDEELTQVLPEELLRNLALVKMKQWIVNKFELENKTHHMIVEHFLLLYSAHKDWEDYLVTLEILGKKDELIKLLPNDLKHYFIQYLVTGLLPCVSLETQQKLASLIKAIDKIKLDPMYDTIRDFFKLWNAGLAARDIDMLKRLNTLLVYPRMHNKILCTNEWIKEHILKRESGMVELDPYEINRILMHGIIVDPNDSERWTATFHAALKSISMFIEDRCGEDSLRSDALMQSSYTKEIIKQLKDRLLLKEGQESKQDSKVFYLPEQIKNANDWVRASRYLDDDYRSQFYLRKHIRINHYLKVAFERTSNFTRDLDLIINSLPPEHLNLFFKVVDFKLEKTKSFYDSDRTSIMSGYHPEVYTVTYLLKLTVPNTTKAYFLLEKFPADTLALLFITNKTFILTECLPRLANNESKFVFLNRIGQVPGFLAHLTRDARTIFYEIYLEVGFSQLLNTSLEKLMSTYGMGILKILENFLFSDSSIEGNLKLKAAGGIQLKLPEFRKQLKQRLLKEGGKDNGESKTLQKSMVFDMLEQVKDGEDWLALSAFLNDDYCNQFYVSHRETINDYLISLLKRLWDDRFDSIVNSIPSEHLNSFFDSSTTLDLIYRYRYSSPFLNLPFVSKTIKAKFIEKIDLSNFFENEPYLIKCLENLPDDQSRLAFLERRRVCITSFNTLRCFSDDKCPEILKMLYPCHDRRKMFELFDKTSLKCISIIHLKHILDYTDCYMFMERPLAELVSTYGIEFLKILGKDNLKKLLENKAIFLKKQEKIEDFFKALKTLEIQQKIQYSEYTRIFTDEEIEKISKSYNLSIHKCEFLRMFSTTPKDSPVEYKSLRIS